MINYNKKLHSQLQDQPQGAKLRAMKDNRSGDQVAKINWRVWYYVNSSFYVFLPNI
jgi:hypothetical protein